MNVPTAPTDVLATLTVGVLALVKVHTMAAPGRTAPAGTVIALPLMLTVAMIIYAERKIWAAMALRRGPNVVGPFGLLQTLADGMKLIFKEDFVPDRASRFVYRLAPFLAFVPAFLVWSVIPLGGDFRDFAGEWRFEPRGDGGTHVELDLRIDPGRFLPRALRGVVADAVMRRALSDLKRFVERC